MNDAPDLNLPEILEADHTGAKAREMVALLARSQNLVRIRLRGQRPAAEFKAAEQLAQALDRDFVGLDRASALIIFAVLYLLCPLLGWT